MKASPVGLRARGAADAVDVVVGRVRHVEVDDVRQRLHVDAARRDVGGDEHRELAGLEAGERLRALRLAAVAVDAVRSRRRASTRYSASRFARCLVRVNTITLRMSPALQQLAQQRRLQLRGHRVHGLGDAGRRARRVRSRSIVTGFCSISLRQGRRSAAAWWRRRTASAAWRAGASGRAGCRAGSPCRACGRPRRAPGPRGPSGAA